MELGKLSKYPGETWTGKLVLREADQIIVVMKLLYWQWSEESELMLSYVTKSTLEV